MKAYITLNKGNAPKKVKVWTANTVTKPEFIKNANDFHQLFIEDGGNITMATDSEISSAKHI
jgi:Ni2+-binding GTPase involved in maturation of urease and hydrogenase